MANVSFSRDEVILILDVIYKAKGKILSGKSEELIELSTLLNELPIHPDERKRKNFRTPTGIAQQIRLFRKSCEEGVKNEDVGKLLFEVAFEFEGNEDYLHDVADAIRSNNNCYYNPFGNYTEDIGFPEGVLLGHLHRIIETRDGEAADEKESCDICGLKPLQSYYINKNVLQAHLIVPPHKMTWNTKYKKNCFVRVCPTCHQVLHRVRPWYEGKSEEKILR